jgi:hypothetical protein
MSAAVRLAGAVPGRKTALLPLGIVKGSSGIRTGPDRSEQADPWSESWVRGVNDSPQGQTAGILTGEGGEDGWTGGAAG